MQIFRVVRVFLSRKGYQAFSKQEYLKRIKASHEHIYTKVIFKPVDEVGIRNVLRDDIPIFLVYLGLRPDDLDTFAARTGRRLHDVHVLIARTLTFDAELAIVLREDVRLRAKIEFTCSLEHFLCPLNVLPHQILSPDLKRLREMVDLLVLGGVLELLRFAHSGPENVPFRAIWRDDSYSCRLHSINDRVINMS